MDSMGNFFIISWEIISLDFIRLIQAFFMHQLDLQNINKNYLLPIPKHVGANHPSNFRPINLFNEIYKIISKILIQRLKLVLPKSIADEQSGFFVDRQITDNALNCL